MFDAEPWTARKKGRVSQYEEYLSGGIIGGGSRFFFDKGVARSWCGSGPFSKTSIHCNLQRLTHSKAGKRCHLQHLRRAQTSEHCNLQQLKRRRPKSGEPHLCQKKARATPVQKKNLRPSGVCIYIYMGIYRV